MSSFKRKHLNISERKLNAYKRTQQMFELSLHQGDSYTYPKVTHQLPGKSNKALGLVFAISTCKIAVLKGVKKKAGKVLLAIVGFSIGFNLIQDVT